MSSSRGAVAVKDDYPEEYRSYSGSEADFEVHRAQYALAIICAYQAQRRVRRARLHRAATFVPTPVLYAAGGVGAAGAAGVLGYTAGLMPALSFQAGVAVSVLYTVVMDVRRSLADKDRTWRKRHRIVSWLVPRHPLD
jgi:hypothetical protein